MPIRAAVIVVFLVVLITVWAMSSKRRRVGADLEARARSLQSFARHVQTTTEQVRREIARELHDQLGGLFVASKMDLDWIARRLPDADATLKAKLAQVSSSLDAGLAIKRRLVERLHPSILDHLGLYAALQWQLSESCDAAGITAVSRVPEDDPGFSGSAAIAVFRVEQDVLMQALAAKEVSRIELDAGVVDGWFELAIADNGRARGPSPPQPLSWSLAHRANALGGSCVVEERSDGSARVVLRIPVARLTNV